ncbi:Longin-like domain-containing protein [Lasiosphaeria ovina]|uniref:Longin-like domain-containing protein n=1 Tax=Lasiosphaeria ovina TaxID=92902 RepID=A0AAE0NM29_9PEZI|nr:Longin-like domain-containing protein [Lasiosphaeria ovina]
MATAIPSIACLGVIGRNNNPLHVAIFPSYDPVTNSFAPVRTPLQFSLLLSSTLDVFELRARHNAATGVGLSGDFGLLHAVDERLAAYGFETNTGTKFVVLVDMRGRRIDGAIAAGLVDIKEKRLGAVAVGLREGEMKPVFKAMQTAYVKLLQNPFFDPDEHAPPAGHGGKKITSRKFADDMRRIGETWTPGVTNL